MSQTDKKRRIESPSTTEDHFCEYDTDPKVDNLRIKKVKAVIYPQLLMEEIPASEPSRACVIDSRKCVSRIVHGVDDRIIVVVGPCSIHDVSAAMEYADKLNGIREKYSKELLILMRVYFEKPRTTVGWKGLVNDPHLDETYDINNGLKVCRQLLADITSKGLACATEFLDVIFPQYIADLVSWAAIGARTTESQLHRQLASGLSMPVGFKNSTAGDVQVAIDAIRSSAAEHCFLSITKQGLPAIVVSNGNNDCHVVLRGGATGPNYQKETIQETVALAERNKVNPNLMVDCSHGNSMKDHNNQPKVLADICQQIGGGNRCITGVMIESHLYEGKQNLPPPSDTTGKENLKYGVSVTDACVDWKTTTVMLDALAAAVRARRNSVKL